MNTLDKVCNDISIDFINNPTALGGMVQKLKAVTYQEKLGTLYDKTLRVAALTKYLCANITIRGTK